MGVVSVSNNDVFDQNSEGVVVLTVVSVPTAGGTGHRGARELVTDEDPYWYSR